MMEYLSKYDHLRSKHEGNSVYFLGIYAFFLTFNSTTALNLIRHMSDFIVRFIKLLFSQALSPVKKQIISCVSPINRLLLTLAHKQPHKRLLSMSTEQTHKWKNKKDASKKYRKHCLCLSTSVFQQQQQQQKLFRTARHVINWQSRK